MYVDALQWLMLAPLLGMLCLAAGIDCRQRRIPNWLTLLLVASGIAASFAVGGEGSIALPSASMLGLIVGFTIPFILFAMGALGGGDVKLLAGLGAWVGAAAVIKIFMAAAIIGMGIVLFQCARQRRLSALFRNSTLLTINLINIDTLGADAVCETGQNCRSIDRPLPYAVPVLVGFVMWLTLGF